MNLTYPEISCVVIGINCEKTIVPCLESVKKIDYPKPVNIIYVDGGSKDKSVATANTVNGIKVIELKVARPTPGKGRNAGWRAVAGEWVQFFDSDVIAEKDWLKNAAAYIEKGVGAIFGWLKESEPNRNWFHFVSDLDWYRPVPDAKFCGGNILIRRSVLEETNGYDENLFGGADPELVARMRRKGWKIRGINKMMCHHDINMTAFSQYFKRSLRCGYAYAEAGMKMLESGERAWFFKTIRICVKAASIILLAVIGLFPGLYLCGFLALAVFFSPVIKMLIMRKRLNISLKGAFFYGLHCSINLWPHFFGAAEYFFNIASMFFKDKGGVKN